MEMQQIELCATDYHSEIKMQRTHNSKEAGAVHRSSTIPDLYVLTIVYANSHNDRGLVIY